MIETLEAIRGGGGSVKVGTTGTISALMSRELDSAKSSPAPLPSSSSSSEDANSGDGIPVNLESKTNTDQVSSSSSSKNRTRCLSTNSNRIIGNRTRKIARKASRVVEIVDIKCGYPDKAWVNPITNKLKKKLIFSKLSEAAV